MFKKMAKKQKWESVRKLFLCKCGICFQDRYDFLEHLRDTRRYRDKHYAPDYNEIPFKITEKRHFPKHNIHKIQSPIICPSCKKGILGKRKSIRIN